MESQLKKYHIMRECNALIGLKFQTASDCDVPGKKIEITRKGLKDQKGFPAVELTYEDGDKEICAVAILDEYVKNGGLIVL